MSVPLTNTLLTAIQNTKLLSAVQWGNATTPKTDRRLSYEVGKNGSGDACAINLHSA